MAGGFDLFLNRGNRLDRGHLFMFFPPGELIVRTVLALLPSPVRQDGKKGSLLRIMDIKARKDIGVFHLTAG